MDPREVRDELHAAWRSFFSALGAAGPVIVIVEDIHWADPALLDLLEELADRCDGRVAVPVSLAARSSRPGGPVGAAGDATPLRSPSIRSTDDRPSI